MKHFFGKYRGKVVSNSDPLLQGRLRISVPSVMGEAGQAWAMPCVPYAGPGVGLFAMPPVGANLWIEFEGGDPDHPIWTGCFWGAGEAPLTPAIASTKVLKTDGTTLTFNDVAGGGGFTLEVGAPVVTSPLKLVFNSEGIELSNGVATIKLSPTTVTINDGAFEVT